MSQLKLVDELLRIINVAGLDNLPSDNTRWGSSGDPSDDVSMQSTMLERSQSLSGHPRDVLTGMSIPTCANQPSVNDRLITCLGYDLLTLDYTVTFPLSLVISRKALTKYQLLFRHLLYLKHVEDLLCKTWVKQKNALWKARSALPEVDKWKLRIFSLRHHMLIFCQQFAYYVTNEVLEPNWRRLQTNLTKVKKKKKKKSQ